jgi:hypothetical protein
MLTLHPHLPRQVFQQMKNKILIFTVGMIAGVAIGVLFSVAIKELVIEFKELHISLNKINLKQSQLSQRIDSIQGKLVPDIKKVANTSAQATSKIIVQNPVKSVTTHDTAKQQQQPATDVSSSLPAEDDSDIVVMTNQLVSVLSVHLQNKDTNTISKKNKETDSTLAAMSDVNDLKEQTNYRIEFWKSPLNYKGYKMSRGKIILYGINPITSVNLTLEEGDYYLLVNQGAFKVDFTDDYKPFERITDKNMLKKLGI